MEAAADYSFNKSHAACYGLIAYRTAYLKANYPAEYMAALISSVMSTKDKVPFFVSRCEEMGISVLPPDVNASGHDFVVVEGDIRFGLDAVKNVGYAAVEKILEARESGGPFTSIWDFCARVDCAHRQQEGDREPDQVRRARLDRRDPQGNARGAAARRRAPAQKAQEDALSGQGSIFDLATTRAAPRPRRGRALPAAARGRVRRASSCWRWRRRRSASSSRAIRSPTCATCCARASTARWRSSSSKPDGAWVTVGGLITQAKRIRTKSGEPMMFATLDDLDGQVEMLIFNSAYAANESQGGRRQARDRARPRRPQGARRDEARRAGDRAVRADARGDRGRRRAAARDWSRGRRVRRGAARRRARRAEGRRTRLRRDADRRPEGAARALPRGDRVLLEMETSAGRRACASAPDTASAPRWPCARSSTHLLGPDALVA